MAVVRPFRALRPEADAASAVAAVPYDVVSTDEARTLAAGNPLSFLHVSRSEIDLPPEIDPHASAVYQTAVENFERLRRDAPLIVERNASLYLYRLRAEDHEQTGLAACYSLDEYDRGEIRRHEETRPDKEDDRTRHLLALSAQTGIVFLTYRDLPETANAIKVACRGEPLIDIEAADGVGHTIWRLSRENQSMVTAAFARVPVLYIADGHHRIASAARARDELIQTATDATEARFVIGVAFPDTETRIQPYNRAVTDLAGRTPEQFLDALRERFVVRSGAETLPVRGEVAMYLGKKWYAVELVPGAQPEQFDVTRLQSQLLAPVLRITDIRTDPRVSFVGGARGTGELERLVDTEQAAVAFSLAPVTIDDLFAVSDSGGIMPPKSTWFEPKLRDGLLIHQV